MVQQFKNELRIFFFQYFGNPCRVDHFNVRVLDVLNQKAEKLERHGQAHFFREAVKLV
jgi:hypothetical protein